MINQVSIVLGVTFLRERRQTTFILLLNWVEMVTEWVVFISSQAKKSTYGFISGTHFSL